MTMNSKDGRSAEADGLSGYAPSPTVSAVPASIPSAWNACAALDTNVIAQVAAQRVFDGFSFRTLEGPENLRARLLMAARDAAFLGAVAGYKHASAMSARRAETEGLGPQAASAVGEGRDAQTSGSEPL